MHSPVKPVRERQLLHLFEILLHILLRLHNLHTKGRQQVRPTHGLANRYWETLRRRDDMLIVKPAAVLRLRHGSRTTSTAESALEDFSLFALAHDPLPHHTRPFLLKYTALGLHT